MISRDRKADYRNRFWKEIPLPKGYTVEQTDEGLLVRLHWFSLPKFMPFITAGSMLLAAFGVPLVTQLDELLRRSPWVLVCAIALAFAGALMEYTALAMLVDRVTIRITPRDFHIHLSPLPVPDEVQLSAGQLDQLYTEQVVHRFRSGVMIDYKIMAILADGQVLEVMVDLDYDGAKFLERQIEGWLGITNRLVPGEACGRSSQR
jgi:hypothetical protein